MIQAEKVALIVELNGSKYNPTCINVLKLLDMMIDEMHVENETEENEKQFFRNQGGIKKFKELKDYITRGLPTAKKSVDNE